MDHIHNESDDDRQDEASNANQFPHSSSHPTTDADASSPHTVENIDEALTAMVGAHEPSEAFREVLDTIQPTFGPKREPAMTRLAVLLGKRSKSRSSTSTAGSRHEKKKRTSKQSKLPTVVQKFREQRGARELMQEIRARRDEYLQTVEALLTKSSRKNKYAEDHPYVALRKRIEAMSRAGENEYNVKYDPLLTKPKLSFKDIHIYGTGYINERKNQARREQFTFGLNLKDRYDEDKLDEFFYNPKEKPDYTKWSSNTELNVAYLAIVFSASNLFRFPHACYVNGGIIFFLMYVFLIIAFIQPIIFFEMLIGQFSNKGEWGFGKIHKYAKGFPHALVFVNITVVTLNNALLGYAGLYAAGALYTNPGTCYSEWSSLNSCIPYDAIESSKQLLIEKSKRLTAFRQDHKLEVFNATLYFSTELFFRYYVMNWRGKYKDFFHWKLVVAFMIVVLIILPTAFQTYIVSGISRAWICLACALPILLSLVLLHQYIFRGGYYTPRYFSLFNWDRCLYLEFWTDALEMAISTVGVGYGIIIRVSSRTTFRYSRILKSSWIISIAVISFCFLCSMVVYTELGILGTIAEAKEFIHIFAEGFGVSFVSLSGALLKTGPSWFFTTLFFGMTIFNIWPQIIATQMSIGYIQEILLFKNAAFKKVVAVLFTVMCEIGIIILFASQAGYSTADSFNLFRGAGAACTIILSEMGIAFLLHGFREFMTDIEIMLDHQLSFTFQIQMRYIVGPVTAFTVFLVGIEWCKSPPIQIGKSHRFETSYLGVFLNGIPAVIMIVFAYIELRKSMKVAPSLENSKFIDKRKATELYWKTKPRWAGRRGAVSSGKDYKSVSRLSRFSSIPQEILNHEEGKEMHYIHISLMQQLRELFSTIKTKALWNRLVNKILVNQKFKSLHRVTSYVLRREEIDKMSMEVSFLQSLIHQCSISDLTAACSKKLESKQLVSEPEQFLLEKLLLRVDYISDDFDSSEDENLSQDDSLRFPWSAKASATVSRVASSASSNSIFYRRVIGKQEKTDEEIRLELIMRIKKHLGHPFENEFRKFQTLRNRRLQKETKATRANDPLPEEHFITIKVTNSKQTSVVTTVHIIVVRSSDHFVLKRLPLPRPLIVKTTDVGLDSFPGKDETNKIYQFVIEKMKHYLSKVDLPTLELPKPQVLLIPNINEDVYSFLDPIRTCVVVLESTETFERFKNKFRWLKPPTRRQHRVEDIPPRPEQTFFEIEELTVLELMNKSVENQRINKMWLEPPDITYHPPGDDSPESIDTNISASSSSDDSSSSSNGEEFKHYDRPKLLNIKRLSKRHKIDIVDENTFKILEKELRKTFKRKGLTGTSTSFSNLDSVRHLTTEDWKKRHHEDKKTLYVLHSNQPRPIETSLRALPNVPLVSNQDESVETTDLVRSDLSIQPVWSRGEEQIPALKTGVSQTTNKNPSTNQVVLALAERIYSTRDFSNLKNEFEHYAYYTEGRTLIIEKKEHERMIEMASSSNSFASTRNPTAVHTNLKLARTDALSKFPM